MTEEIKPQVQDPEYVEVQPKPATGGVGGNAKSVFDNFVNKLVASLETLPSKFQNIGNQNLQKIIKNIVIVSVVIIVIAFVASLIVGLFNGGNGKKEVQAPVPTAAVYQSQQPSVYAEDGKILEIEERAKILDKEMNDVIIRETILNSPSLDFDIEFKVK